MATPFVVIALNLTAPVRLRMEMIVDLLCEGGPNSGGGGKLFGASLLDLGDAPKFVEQVFLAGRAKSRNSIESRACHGLRTPLPVVGDGEAVGFIAHMLEQVEGR